MQSVSYGPDGNVQKNQISSTEAPRPPGGDDRDFAAADAAIPRPQLASGGVQLLISGADLGLQITPADLAADSDVIEIHQEFYGVPWAAFLNDTAPPAAWVAKMDQIAGAAHATGKQKDDQAAADAEIFRPRSMRGLKIPLANLWQKPSRKS